MTTCGAYVADPSFQLQGGPTGPVDCTAHSCSDVIDAATCGKQDPAGRTIRLLSTEPSPDPKSPGLNLVQVAAVAREHYGVYLDVRIGSRAITWTEYEKRRKAGQPTLLQVRYAPIADSDYNAGRGFRGNHCLAETTHATYDPLADGRPGAFRFNGTVYTRSVISRAAATLDIGGGAHPKPGTVWAAFAHDVVPDYAVDFDPGDAFYEYRVSTAGTILSRYAQRTPAGFAATCEPPAYHRWPKGPVAYKRLVKITSGARTGRFIEARFAHAT